MKQIDVREGAKRQHRVVALFAVLQCWMRNLDGIVFDRPHLERLLGLQRFKDKRVRWIRTDFEEFFPFREVYYHTGRQNSFGSLYVSRRKLKGVLPDGAMADEKRIEQMAGEWSPIGHVSNLASSDRVAEGISVGERGGFSGRHSVFCRWRKL